MLPIAWAPRRGCGRGRSNAAEHGGAAPAAAPASTAWWQNFWARCDRRVRRIASQHDSAAAALARAAPGS